MIEGLRDFFNASLGTYLLYRFERVQYRDVALEYKHLQLSDIYGAEHLLRLAGA